MIRKREQQEMMHDHLTAVAPKQQFLRIMGHTSGQIAEGCFAALGRPTDVGPRATLDISMATDQLLLRFQPRAPVGPAFLINHSHRLFQYQHYHLQGHEFIIVCHPPSPRPQSALATKNSLASGG